MDKIINCNHPSPSATIGNHIWKGAAPILINKAIDNKYCENITPVVIVEDANRIMAEASAWVRKYFRLASDENWLVSEEIRGIKDNRFSSRPIHTVNQEEEETAIIIPNVKVEKKRRWEGIKRIKKRGVYTLINGVWAH